MSFDEAVNPSAGDEPQIAHDRLLITRPVANALVNIFLDLHIKDFYPKLKVAEQHCRASVADRRLRVVYGMNDYARDLLAELLSEVDEVDLFSLRFEELTRIQKVCKSLRKALSEWGKSKADFSFEDTEPWWPDPRSFSADQIAASLGGMLSDLEKYGLSLSRFKESDRNRLEYYRRLAASQPCSYFRPIASAIICSVLPGVSRNHATTQVSRFILSERVYPYMMGSEKRGDTAFALIRQASNRGKEALRDGSIPAQLHNIPQESRQSTKAAHAVRLCLEYCTVFTELWWLLDQRPEGRSQVATPDGLLLWYARSVVLEATGSLPNDQGLEANPAIPSRLLERRRDVIDRLSRLQGIEDGEALLRSVREAFDSERCQRYLKPNSTSEEVMKDS